MGACPFAHAGTFNENFNNGQVPPGTAVYGDAVVEPTGGVGDSGVLKVTKAVNSQSGSFIIEDLDNGAAIYGFRMTFMARIGGGTAVPADGWSVNAAPDLPDGPFGEAGAGTGITVMFDTYDNVDGNPNNGVGEAPQISLKAGGQVVATSGLLPLSDMITGSQFVPVLIALNPDGSFDLEFNGKAIFTKFYFPGYQPLEFVRFGFGGRTGGSNENAFFDDLNIETFLTPQPGFVANPADVTAIAGSAVNFEIQLNNADTATIQWLRNGVAIPGATGTVYTLSSASAGDAGAKFSARVTVGTTAITSTEATLEVVTLNLPATAVRSFSFNDGSTPANTEVYGTAYVTFDGGVNNTGMLLLTDAFEAQSGSFLIEDPHSGAPVFGIAARFDLRMGGGTETPADGFSFNFATDLPETGGDVEDGLGSGLSVLMDVYDNGAGEAPAFGIKFGGVVVAERKVPISAMQTGDDFADVIIRLTPDGLLDLAWNGAVIFNRVPVPGFTSVSGGRIGLYARTGGLSQVHAVDNLRIYTYLTAEQIRIAQQPQSQLVLLGRPATFSVEPNLTDTTTYQWFLNGTAIAGATLRTLTLPATTAADNNAKLTVEVRRGGQTVTSAEATLSVLDLNPPANPQLSYDFNGALPAGAQVAGTARLDSADGVNNSGVLKITDAVNSQSGGFRTPVIAGGAQMLAFTLAVDVLAGGGTTPPADGFSINLGSDVPVSPTGDAENGGGTGLTFAFDTYDNGGGEAPSIDLRYKGQLITSTKVPLDLVNVADTYIPVLIRVQQDGTVDLAYGEVVIYHNFPVPDFVPLAGARISIMARTGGLNANHWFDNLRLGAELPAALSITGGPADALVLAGQPALFFVNVSNPQGVTYQWLREGVAIAGATQPTYTTPALAASDHGAGFSVQVAAGGPPLTSSIARVGVLSAFDAGTNPPINANFDDGSVPPGGILLGHALTEEGVLKLTLAENGQSGSFLLDTPASAATIQDFTATWRMRVGGGTDVPADGFSFVLADDIPDVEFGEDGLGSGLVVSFDIYDNGGGEAPAIDIFYRGEPVASRKFEIGVLRTGDAFVPVGVRLNRRGTLDVYYGTTAVYRDLPLPGFAPFAPGRFGWGARTGGLNENQWLDDVKIAVNTQPAVVDPPNIGSIRAGTDGGVTITWTGGGTLQTTSSLTPPVAWQDVPQAVSPYRLTASSPQMFVRIRR